MAGELMDKHIGLIGAAVGIVGTLCGWLASALWLGWRIGKVEEDSKAGAAMVQPVRDLQEEVRTVKSAAAELKETNTLLFQKIDHLTDMVGDMRVSVAEIARNGHGSK